MKDEYKARREARKAARKAARPVPLHGPGGVIGYGFKCPEDVPEGWAVIRTDESEDRLRIASEAAFVILAGLRQGFRPVKAAWLSLLSNEPIGLTVGIGGQQGQQDYTGFLIRYEAGTNGRRIVKVPEILQAQLGGDIAHFGDVPFPPLDFGRGDWPEIFAVVAKLCAVREADANIAV